MFAFLNPVTAWFANNKLARDIAIGVGGLILLIIGYKVWKGNVENGVRRQMREEEQRRELETLNKIEERSDAHIDQAERIRAANPVTGDPDRMSDTPLQPWHYRD